MRLLLAFAIGSVLIWGTAIGDDWPQWRGKQRDGISQEQDLLQDWPAAGPKLVWMSKEVGLGYSGPAVVGNRIYIMGAKKDVSYLFCRDAATGDEIWRCEMGETYRNNWGDGPRGTPTVDGDRVYALAGFGELVCANVEDGKIVWQLSLVEDLEGTVPVWGYSESPLIEGNRLICTPGGDKGAIAALDKMTGKVLWRTEELTETAHYASVIPAKFSPLPHLVQLTQEQVVGFSASDGKVLWTTPWPGRTAVIPTPVVTENRVYVSSGYGVGDKLMSLAADKGGVTATEVYATKTMKNHHGGVILVNGHLYGFSDGTGWLCQDLETGAEVWSERDRLGKGCLTYGDGRFYCLGEGDGEVALIEASAKGWQEHGRFKLTPQTKRRKPDGRIWTHPVISDGKLYLRDQELFFCFDVKE